MAKVISHLEKNIYSIYNGQDGEMDFDFVWLGVGEWNDRVFGKCSRVL